MMLEQNVVAHTVEFCPLFNAAEIESYSIFYITLYLRKR